MWLMPGADVVDLLDRHAEIVRQLVRGALHAVAQADRADAAWRGSSPRQLIAIGFV